MLGVQRLRPGCIGNRQLLSSDGTRPGPDPKAAFGFVGFLASGRDASLSDKTIGRVPVTGCDSGLRREMGPDETAIYFHRGLKSD